MRDDVKQTFQTITTAYETIYSQLAQLARALVKETDPAHLADAAYAMREAEKMLKRLRIQADAVGITAQRVACIVLTKQDEEKVQTEYVVAHTDLTLHANVPSARKEPEKFRAMMEYLEVPPDLWDYDDPERDRVVSVSWPGFVQLLTERASEGKPLPPGIDVSDTKPIYRLKLRKRRGILED